MAFDKAKAIRAAEKYLAQGKITAAIQEYRRIVENDPEDFTALNTLGDLHARVNQKQEAVVYYRRVAEHYREQGFALKAVAMYKKVTRFEASDPRTALALASLYEQQGLMADARAQYLIAAEAFTRRGDSREALSTLGRIADLDPSDTQVRLRLAEGYSQCGQEQDAAEAYTVAGERLAARGEQRQALDAFNRALGLMPALHAALAGALAAHIALGTPHEITEVLEQAVAEQPRDAELHAMLTRAYLEAEDVRHADRAAEDLIRLDAASYMLFFEVARLYIRQGNIADAIRLLGRISEQALSGRQDDELLALTQEVLARDPEHLVALGLLARIYAWQREDERLRMALERLADAAQMAGEEEEERRALAQLVRLAPDEPRYAGRLDALGGPVNEDSHESAAHSDEVPTFESFMLNDEAAGAAFPGYAPDAPASEFEWNAVGDAHTDARSNVHGDARSDAQPSAPTEPLVFERGEADAGAETAYGFSSMPSETTDAASQFAGFQEMSFESEAVADSADGLPSTERMLLQELESVDFYIEQGYADIARETLDMLERQYGSHAEIERRRAALPADMFEAATGEAPARASQTETEDVTFGDSSSFDFTTLAPPAESTHVSSNGNHSAAETFADETFETFADHHPSDESEASGAQQAAPARAASTGPHASTVTEQRTDAQGGGIDPGLAAIFDEFRESIEEEEAGVGEDFETHYQMGLAYREMGLLDQAVEEFQLAGGLTSAGDGTPRYLNCCNLLGHCFMEKNMMRPAAVWFKRGLEAPGHTEDEYQALRYDLAATYEQMGEKRLAFETFSEVYAIDVNYRGVAERLRRLQESGEQ